MDGRNGRLFFLLYEIATGAITTSSLVVILVLGLICSIIISIIFAPMSWSFQMLFLRNKRGERYGFSFIFSGYKDFLRVAGTQLLLSCYLLLWTCYFALPFTVFSAIFCMSSPKLLAIIAAFFLLFIGSIVAAIIILVKSISYCLTPYILFDNPDIKYDAAIEQSITMMKAHKWHMFRLVLTFVGWSFVGLLTLGIAFFWLIPYMNTAMANFYDGVKEDYMQRQA